MTPAAEAWLDRNNAYLGAELAALRRRLKALVPDKPGEPAPAPSMFSRAARLRLRLLRRRLAPDVPLLSAPDGTTETGAAEMDSDAADLAAAPPALIMLGHRLGLSQFERGILFLCVAAELDTGIGAAFAEAQGDRQRTYPTFALAMILFEDPAWEAVSPEGPLRHWRLIEISQPAATPLTQAALRADERIVNYVKGLNHLDDRLAALLTPIDAPPQPLPPSQRAVAAKLAGRAGGGEARLALNGADRAAKRRIAAAAAGALGLHLFRLTAETIPSGADLELAARLWARDRRLLPVALLIDAHDVEPTASADSPAARVRAFAEAGGGIVFVDSRDGLPGLEPDLAVDVTRPTPAEQRSAWVEALGAAAGADVPAMLASQFDLGQPEIEAIAAEAVEEPDDEGLAARLWKASLARSRPALSRLAERLDPKARWDDLVLPETETALLHRIVDQVRARALVYDDWGYRERMNRGLGISALFAGDSGTGKTMAAEVIANALALDLYRIDLSAVVSKYIGETEKNLRQVFDAAEAGGAILFFDEADALFGKRGEVKDSHDRYANIEINYLLQRMEAFGGLAILATNRKSDLDNAFARRLRFVVDFPYPSAAERRRIWERAFAPGVPLRGVDFDHLAAFDLSGGTIHNVALNAAFLAAGAEPREVTMPLLLEAARMEFRKLGSPVNEGNFRRIQAVAGTVGGA
ncbi:MAG TPA: ATP-binding protein [Allosphingosinicella sp.]|nr:ATP-binding protein [Allosphingosinicella sp.]